MKKAMQIKSKLEQTEEQRKKKGSRILGEREKKREEKRIE